MSLTDPHLDKILIVEDDHALNNGIALSFKEAQTLQAFSLEQARQLFNETVDLIILDLNLTDGSGLDFCREIRQTSAVPIIILTANDLEIDIVSGLESGADDYITKPFSLAVLRARVGAVLRRQSPAETIFAQEPFYFNFAQMVFSVNGQNVELSKTEQRLLRLLCTNCGRTLSRQFLLDRVWSDGAEFVNENALSVTIKRLREKLPAAPIKTVYGLGYTWEK